MKILKWFKDLAKANEPEDEGVKGPTLLNFEIVDECSDCGEEVKPSDRQQLEFNVEELKWYRMCERCLRKHTKLEIALGGQRHYQSDNETA